MVADQNKEKYWYGLNQYLPTLGFGAWQIGGIHSINGRANGWGEDVTSEIATQLIATALEAGVRFFDTAQGYGHGRSEKLLGEGLKKHPAGERAVICTKIPYELNADNLGISISKAIEISLKNLDREMIDIVLLHNPPDSLNISTELIDAMEAQITRGKIVTYGVSATTISGAQHFLNKKFGSCLEWNFNILERRPINVLFSLLKKNKINFIARSPLCRGLLTENYLKNFGHHVFSKQDIRSSLDFKFLEWVYLSIKEFKTLLPFEENISSIALQYPFHFDEVSVVIPGVKSIGNLLAAIDIWMNMQKNEEFNIFIDKFLPINYPGFN